ncbi:glycosyltransferase family 39 protein [bacterium]|nr:glycosyltransferase family 39 protein [candidate division CSSED10-310 bacterium]
MTRKFWSLLLLIIILATVIRFYNIDKNSIWGDEACMIYLCRDSIPEIIEALQSPDRPDVDVAPPVYFILLHFWIRIWGDSVFVLRSLSAIFGVLTVFVSAMLGKELFGNTTGLITAFIVTINPFQVWYSQEIRMYTLACLMAVLVMWSFFKICSEKRIFWIVFWISSISLMYTQYYGFLLLAALGVFTLCNAKAVFLSRWKMWMLTFVLLAISFLPWLPTLVTDYRHAGASGGFPNLFNPIKTPVFLFTKMTLFGNETYIYDHFLFYLLAIAVFAFLLCWSTIKFWRLLAVKYLIFIAGFPFLTVYLASLAGLRIYKSHPFILFQIPILILIGFGIVRSIGKSSASKQLVLLMVTGMNIYVLLSLNFSSEYVKPRINEMVEWIKSRYHEADLVAVAPSFIPNPMENVGDLLVFRYYSRDEFRNLYLVGNNSEDLYNSIRNVVVPGKRIFLVYQINQQVLPEVKTLKTMLSESYQLLSTKNFQSRIRGFSVGVSLYAVSDRNR